MAHFAKISEQNIVLSVLTLDNSKIISNGVESEIVGQEYLEQHNNWPAHLWIKTSYNTEANQHKLGGTPFRGNYASIGYTWDSENQIFWRPKPYASWTKNLSTASWEAPLPYPTITTYDTIWTQEMIDAGYAPEGTVASDPKNNVEHIIAWDENSYQTNGLGWKAKVSYENPTELTWNGTNWS